MIKALKTHSVSKASANLDSYCRRSVLLFSFAATLAIFCHATRVLAQQVVRGHVPSATAFLSPLGNLEPTQQLHLAIGLPLRNTAALTSLVQQIYDPTSRNYRIFLTPAEFTQRFGPSMDDYRAVSAFAQAHNLTVTYAHSNRMVLDVAGQVADIENALHVHMLVYQHPTERRRFYAPDADPSVDLSVPILKIGGLDDYALPRPALRATPLGRVANAKPNGGSGPGGEYEGYDFRNAYVPGVALTGTGQSVGLLEFDGYTTTDINYYENQAGLPSVPLSNVLLDGFSGNPSGSGGEVEVTLDIDMAIAMAPGLSKVIVYEAPNVAGMGVWYDMLNRMADDDLASQLSCSWFQPAVSADPVAEQIFVQMQAQGQSFFVASGDSDAYNPTCNAGITIPFPCDSPNVTLVGGTALQTSGPLGSWVSEAVWNWNIAAGCQSVADVGSSGGISVNYVIPAWQTGLGMSANQGSTTMRNVPDVALTADNVYIFCAMDGGDLCIAGTSCAAPLWAGFAALVNQQTAVNGAPRVGFLNPALYAIGKGANYGSDFHDITTGNNESSCSPDVFPAVSGYDLCTGWGTPNGSSLINALAGSCLFTPVSALNTARYYHTASLLPNGLVLVAGGTNNSGLLPSAELYNPANGTWTATGPLSTARYQHTATLLPNGKVLVTGGWGASGFLVNSELYDPANGTWTATGPLSTARYQHTATLLPNGKVLVTGGWNASGYLASAELYNPANGTWTATGPMTTARYQHTATLLPNGLVLAAAGSGASGVLNSAELYNPANGTWTATGSMQTKRNRHTATLLPNGLVLIAGGWPGAGGGGGNGTTSAELYNPATRTWAVTGSLNYHRLGQTATLLPNGLVLTVGSSQPTVVAAELYNPASGTWTVTCSLNAGRAVHTATLLPNGFVLVAGGYAYSSVLSSSELYPVSDADVSGTGTWVNTGSLTTARYAHTATLLPNGLVLVTGGYGGSGYLASAELYSPPNRTWTATGPMATARYQHTATLLPNGLVLVTGGWNAGGYQASAELYNPANGTWTTTGPMAIARYQHTATLLPNGLVLASAGIGTSGVLTSAELYNPANGTWTATGPMATARSGQTATLLPNGQVLVAGGFPGVHQGGATSSAELYNPASGTWAATASMNNAHDQHTATLLPNGLVLVTGGYGTAGVLASAELYNPAGAGTWTAVGSMNIPRAQHTATLLPNGIVAVTGGYGTSSILNSVEFYDSASGTWTILSSSPLNLATYQQTATLLPNGFLLIAAGLGASGPLNNAEVYNP